MTLTFPADDLYPSDTLFPGVVARNLTVTIGAPYTRTLTATPSARALTFTPSRHPFTVTARR